MLASGRDKELLEFWRNVDMAKIMSMEDSKINNIKNILLEELSLSGALVLKGRGMRRKKNE